MPSNSSRPLTPHETECLNALGQMLSRDVSHHILLNKMGREFGIAPYRLSHGFKMLFGVTIHEYSMCKKMECAKKLLEQNNSIRDVAFITGYAGVSYFTFCFKNYWGITPGVFKKNALFF